MQVTDHLFTMMLLMSVSSENREWSVNTVQIPMAVEAARRKVTISIFRGQTARRRRKERREEMSYSWRASCFRC